MSTLPKLVTDIIHFYIERHYRRKLNEEFGRRVKIEKTFNPIESITLYTEIVSDDGRPIIYERYGYRLNNGYRIVNGYRGEVQRGWLKLYIHDLFPYIKRKSIQLRLPLKYHYSSGLNDPSGYK